MALNKKDLEQAILIEKEKGMSDIQIGKKYGVTYKYIEKVITKTKGINISRLNGKKVIKRLHPTDFKEEKTTVWSFKHRGDWATHSGDYRGNWSPYIPRNVILKYSQPGDLVLDYFCGAGTTAIECKLLGRRCIALDINEKAIELAKKNLNFTVEAKQLEFIDNNSVFKIFEPQILVGDARNLSSLQDNSVDLICAHPPYANIIHYTDSKEGDLSLLDIDEFLKEMMKVAKESYRVLKPGHKCAILIGDLRRHKHVVPLGFRLIDVFLEAGFKLRELVIKRQHNCKTTGFWYANSIKFNFLLLAHEYLPIFEKPLSTTTAKESRISYTPIVLKFIKPVLKKKLNELETTTVWIFPEVDFEKHLNTNVIERYWTNDGYVTIDLFANSNSIEDICRTRKKQRNSLVYIKAIPLNENNFDINIYLKGLKAIIEQEIKTVNKGGVIAILTQDIRRNNFLIPLAKCITDTMNFNELVLKEIVVVTKNNYDKEMSDNDNQFLKIVHSYLLVYEVKK